jgi:D-xylose transport system permease protein
MLLALAAIWAFFAWREPVFMSERNLSLLSIELAVTATLALGMLLVLLPGQIDLSAGSGVGLTGAVAAVLVFAHGVPAPLALAIALAAGVAVWAGMGALVAIERVPAFIITLGGLLVFRGLHWLTIENRTVPIVEGGGTNLYSLLTLYLPPAGSRSAPWSGRRVTSCARAGGGGGWLRGGRRVGLAAADVLAQAVFLVLSQRSACRWRW